MNTPQSRTAAGEVAVVTPDPIEVAIEELLERCEAMMQAATYACTQADISLRHASMRATCARNALANYRQAKVEMVP